MVETSSMLKSCQDGCLKCARLWSRMISGLPLTSNLLGGGGFRTQMLVRWVSLLLACAGMASSASVYAFFAWQTPMRAILNQTETESNLVATLGNVGMTLAFPAGMLYETFGSQAAALVGAVFTGIGYFFLWLGVGEWKGRFSGNVWIVDVLYFLVGLGGSFTYMASLMPNVDNFQPEQRGKVIGLLDGSLSLGPTLLSVLYNSAFTNGHTENGQEGKQNLSGYFLTIAILSIAINIALFLFVGRVKEEHQQHRHRASETSPAGMEPSLNDRSINQSMAIGVQIEDDDEQKPLERNQVGYGSTSDDSQSDDGNDNRLEPEEPPNDFAEFPFADLPITRVIFHWNFYFLLGQYVLNACLQLTFQTNIPTYLRSFDMNEYNLLFTVLNTALQTLSKFAAGFISDLIALDNRAPRAVVFLIPYTLQTLFLAVSVFYGDNFVVMIMTTIFLGVANGVTWCQTPTLIGELFGANHLGSNWGWSMVLTAIFGFPFTIGFSSIYEAAIYQPGEKYCYHLVCFKWSFALLAGVSFATLILSVGLTQNMFRNKEDRMIAKVTRQANRQL